MKNRTNIRLVEEYREWLMTLNYSESKYSDYPMQIRRMFEYMEQREVIRLDQITKELLTKYRADLSQLVSKKTKNRLSLVHINSHLSALRNFSEFLQLTKAKILPVEHLKNHKIVRVEKQTLTLQEIEHLFELTKGKNKYLLRDRAMLAVFYGLGLRRAEGTHLFVKDIDFVRSYVHVRKGKGNRERIVPMSKGVQNHLKEYIKEARTLFTRGNRVRSCFVSNTGKPLDSQMLYLRLKYLLKKSTLESLKEKQNKIGLHTLRHSIATHLMENGMDFEQISNFLGHKSIDSTQIYTHIQDETFD